MNLDELMKFYVNKGYTLIQAEAKVCQDIILLKISKSPFINNVTIKSGVVMHDFSKDKRRATKDIDLDFIKYSLSNESIIEFIDKMNFYNDLKIEIMGNIEELKQQSYHGKRVYLKITDNYCNHLTTKLDIGVNNNFDVKQENYCFSLDVINENVTLLVNSFEQIFIEKLKSLLRLGEVSTRYKDILDIFYLVKMGDMNKLKVISYMQFIIFNDDYIKESNIDDVYIFLKKLFNKKSYLDNFDNIKNNWLELPIKEVTDCILSFIDGLRLVTI